MMAASHRVLVVEDHEDTGAALAEVFVVLGAGVAVARTGDIALKITRLFRPQFAFIDIHLPDVDGYELAMRIRALAGTDIRLLAISGRSDRTPARSLDAGFEEHLVKPVSLERIRAILHPPV